jgi:multiple sugar transport system ATP-binding protein
MGDQIVVMRDGYIEQTGSPLQLYDHPANLFVAGFIGSPAMNFLPGTLRRNGAVAMVELAGGGQVQAPALAGGADGQKVIFGTRPEHLSLVGDGGIGVQVAVVEPTGADTFVSCRHHSTDMSVVFRERHDFTPGSTIRLQPVLEHSHLFDAASGNRLTVN